MIIISEWTWSNSWFKWTLSGTWLSIFSSCTMMQVKLNTWNWAWNQRIPTWARFPWPCTLASLLMLDGKTCCCFLPFESCKCKSVKTFSVSFPLPSFSLPFFWVNFSGNRVLVVHLKLLKNSLLALCACGPLSVCMCVCACMRCVCVCVCGHVCVVCVCVCMHVCVHAHIPVCKSVFVYFIMV